MHFRKRAENSELRENCIMTLRFLLTHRDYFGTFEDLCQALILAHSKCFIFYVLLQKFGFKRKLPEMFNKESQITPSFQKSFKIWILY